MCYACTIVDFALGVKLQNLEYRTKEWDKDFFAYMKGLEAKKPVIWCGDLNVAHTPIDLANPQSNVRGHLSNVLPLIHSACYSRNEQRDSPTKKERTSPNYFSLALLTYFVTSIRSNSIFRYLNYYKVTQPLHHLF